eukprot:2325410-Pleurochrysis_carterae.AAC.4
MLRNINHTLRERIVLANWTRSPELRAGVASLRRTRFKVVAVQLTVIVANAGNFAIQIWLISNSARQLYAPYNIPCRRSKPIFPRRHGVSPTNGQAASTTEEPEASCPVEATAVSSFFTANTQAVPHAVSARAAPIVISVVVDENGAREPRTDRGNAEKPAAVSSAKQASPWAKGGHAQQQQQTQMSKEAEQTGQRSENQEQQGRQRDNWDC